MARSKFVYSGRPTFDRERALSSLGYHHIAGVDEAGRGPLAGPVVAAAIVLPLDFTCPHFEHLNDSKQIVADLRDCLFHEITEATAYGVGIIEAPTIDIINIRQASWQAMQLAVANLQQQLEECATAMAIDYVLIDGLPYGPGPWAYEALVQGDARSLSIAAASVLAKVTRDRLMEEHDAQYPQYGFSQHKGYPTPAHLRALQQHGPCVLHRRSFGPVRDALAAVPTARGST